ncbi:four helix bundle protein [Daejeonella lutea]|uniref:Four helix bundle protein n=1 Tax=Daejeonella lutea TaxID=572036 RepID=A0A1T5EFZ5_9SPHI|nr:four helix bundle protein [Daejeonella lutea]SKB82809.1 four helix bundle protein [Daejeonella lutea]
MHNFKKLNIWVDAMILAREVYFVTSKYPKDEKYGLVSQMNRSVVFVPSNIAEGSSRSSAKEFSHYLKIALGSLFELETQTILSYNLKIMTDSDLDHLSEKNSTLQKMINGFLTSLK